MQSLPSDTAYSLVYRPNFDSTCHVIAFMLQHLIIVTADSRAVNILALYLMCL